MRGERLHRPEATRSWAVLVCALLAAGGAVPEASAQAVRWDSLGLLDTYALTILPGPTGDGSQDALLAYGTVPDPYAGVGRRPGLFRLGGGQPEWEDLTVSRFVPGSLFTTRGGTVLGGASSGATRLDRSTDGGRTWTRRVVDAHARCFFEPDPAAVGGAPPVYADAVYACGTAADDPTHAVLRSYADGAAGSWVPLGAVGPPGETAYWVEALAALPPSDALPDGRLVVGVANGIATSDDGGLTWQVSEMWRPFGWWVYSLAVAADSTHAYGGTMLAGLGDFSRGVNGVWASEDGGRRWEERVLWPGLSSGDRTVLAVGPGSVVYAATNDIAPDPNLGRVYRTADRGATWESISGEGTGWGGYGAWVLRVGRDGRLYAATDGGVWATSEPAPVASEPPTQSDAESDLLLSVHPNPASRSATVVLTVPASFGDVATTVTVYDALGRRVAREEATTGGPLPRIGAGLLAPGVYLVRAVATTAGGAVAGVATAALTVAR